VHYQVKNELKIEKCTLYKMLRFSNPPIAYVAKNIGEIVKRKRERDAMPCKTMSSALHPFTVGQAEEEADMHAGKIARIFPVGGFRPEIIHTHRGHSRDRSHQVPSKAHLVPCPLLPMTGKLVNRNFFP
jgi:hypothetical protein